MFPGISLPSRQFPCAVVFNKSGEPAVPADLHPNMHDQARALLLSNGRGPTRTSVLLFQNPLGHRSGQVSDRPSRQFSRQTLFAAAGVE